MRSPARSLILLLTLSGLSGIAGAATPGLHVYFAKDFTDQAYQKKVFDKVAGAWKRPSENPKPGSKSVVIATIRKDGTLAETKLHMQSGSDAWDTAAHEAVQAAAPFDPFPKSFRRDSVEVHFHFELNP